MDAQPSHHRLSPSSAHRWLNCTASPAVIELYPDPPSDPKMEGTAAHFLLETCLVGGSNPSEHKGKQIRVKEEGVERLFLVSKEMVRDVTLAVDWIRECANSPGWSGVEARVPLDHFEVGMFGTTDLWHLGQDGLLTVGDFKYGRGDVEVERNAQMLIYATGIIRLIATRGHRGLTKTVRLAILQPRSVAAVPRIKTWTFPVVELDRFEIEVHNALTEINRYPSYRMGAWCEHCPALGACPVSKELTRTTLAPALLTSDMTTNDAVRIFAYKDLLEKAVEKAEAMLTRALLGGQTIPGVKLVTTRKHRKWRDEELVKQRLSETFGPQVLEAPTPATVDKMGKDGKQLVAELAFTPPGDPAVGAEDDKRSPYVKKSAIEMFGSA